MGRALLRSLFVNSDLFGDIYLIEFGEELVTKDVHSKTIMGKGDRRYRNVLLVKLSYGDCLDCMWNQTS